MVKFIKSLNIEEVPTFGRDEIQYHSFDMDFRQISDDVFARIPTNESVGVDHHVVPVHRICRDVGGVRSEDLIAYSKEVQELLEIPIDMMCEENDRLLSKNIKLTRTASELERQLDDIKSLSFFGRLKFLCGFEDGNR